MGADLAYMGTRWIATPEANVSDDYRRTILESTAADIVYRISSPACMATT